MPVLDTVFSRADALKRQLYDMLTNPRDYASMVAGRTQEASRAAQTLQEQAFSNPDRPFQITNPQALSQLTQMIMGGPLGFAPAGITAYHGSPYLFRQLDPSKMGTGEGAQAYGVGAGYTAQARPVAEEYARNVSTNVARRSIDTDPQVASAIMLMQTPGSGGIDNLEKVLQSAYGYKPEVAKQTVEKVKKTIGGYLYKGDIPEEILPKFLDWDKPLTKNAPQEVKDAFNKIIKDYPEVKDAFMKGFKENQPGWYYYSVLGDLAKTGDLAKNQQFASDVLENVGIRGIRYLDQGSRGEGKGTSNFIPFRPEDYKIQEINDIPIQQWMEKGLLSP